MTREELANLVCHNPNQLHWYLRRIDEYTESVIATTRRETMEEIIEQVKHELKGSELFPLPERTDDISDEELKLSKIQTLSEILDQLPDKQEV